MYPILKRVLVTGILAAGLYPALLPAQTRSSPENNTEQPVPYEADTGQVSEEQAYNDGAYADEEYVDEEYTDDVYAAQDQGRPIFSHTPYLEQTDRYIPDNDWQRLTDDPDFRYTEPESEVRKVQPQQESAWLRFFGAIFNFLASGAGKVIIFGLVALLVVYLIVRAVQLQGNIFFSKKDKKLPVEAADELSDDYIPASWEQVIEEAARTGNYRLAVRHSYRYLLHLLRERELIQYQTAKTNYQYAYELAGTSLYQPFMQLTRGYEYAWYGGFAIARERFEAYYEQFNGIKNDLL